MEDKFKKVLYNEVTLVVAIVGLTWGVFNTFTANSQVNNERTVVLEKDVAYIKDSIKEIPKLRDELRETRETMIELQGQIKQLLIIKK